MMMYTWATLFISADFCLKRFELRFSWEADVTVELGEGNNALSLQYKKLFYFLVCRSSNGIFGVSCAHKSTAHMHRHTHNGCVGWG